MRSATTAPASVRSRLWNALRSWRWSRRGWGPTLDLGSPGLALNHPAAQLLDAVELTALIKTELRRRFDRGERPTAAEYLDRFPDLFQNQDRVISLAYEEFCLLEEVGAEPSVEGFCHRYAPWRDSLASQLRFHRELSQVLSQPQEKPRFPQLGDRFLWFEIGTELGRGGAGRVYLARDETLGGRRVALKIAPDQGEEPVLQGRLDHPNIVPVMSVEIDPDSGLRALSMPYYPGLSLDTANRRLWIDQKIPTRSESLWNVLGPPQEDELEIEASGRPAWSGFPRKGSYSDGVAWIVLKLAEALAHAHRRGVLHGDIKPANVLLTRRAGPLLLDFNLSRRTEPTSAVSTTLGGTLPYMAPEQLAAFLDPARWDGVTSAADLYSLGLLFRELLTGERPAGPDPALPLSRAISSLHDERQAARPISARSRNPHVPHALDAILAKCLAPKPEDRYQDAVALVDDLRCHLQRQPLKNNTNPSRIEAAINFGYRNRTRLAAAATILVVLAGAQGYRNWTQKNWSDRVRSILDRASDAASRHQYALAIDRYRYAESLDPNDYRAPHGLAQIAYRTGDYDECVKACNRAVDLLEAQPGVARDRQVSVHRLRAQALVRLASRDYVEASNLYRRNKKTRTPEADALIESCLRRAETAERDLHFVAAYWPGGLLAEDEIEMSRAVLRLGEVASWHDNYRVSVAAFRHAAEHLESASNKVTADKRSQREIEELRRFIKERLKTDEPMLARVR